MNDDFLYKFRKPPRDEFAAALYQKISARTCGSAGTGDSAAMKTSFRTRALRTTALAFAMLAVIATVLFFSPSTRAFAQGILHQFGGYVFVQGTSELDPAKEMAKKEAAEERVKLSPEQEATLQAEKMQMNDQPQQKPADAGGKLAGTIAPDAAAASQLTGFSVLAPAYVPDGYIPGDEKNVTGGWEVSHETGGASARTTYQSQESKSFITIEELKYEKGQTRIVERPEIVDTTVRGQSGVWMPDNGGKSTLAWDENGITYLVVSSSLSLEESLKVAESLGK